MSEQQTVECPACKGKCGKNVESSHQALDSNGNTVTVYSTTWSPCGTCRGSGRVTGGRG